MFWAIMDGLWKKVTEDEILVLVGNKKMPNNDVKSPSSKELVLVIGKKNCVQANLWRDMLGKDNFLITYHLGLATTKH